MQRRTLPNGLTVIYYPTDDKTVSVNVLVKTGSNNESKDQYGISHFIEHMVFEGTKTRDALTIAGEIEGLGGEINAYTSNERTCFYVKSLRRHAEKSVEILSDIIMNPTFMPETTEKERNTILSEVGMRTDQPRWHQWDLFMEAVFGRHPAGHPVIGTAETVRSIMPDDLKAYWRKNYSANNIIITIAGDVDDPFSLISRHFGKMKPGTPDALRRIQPDPEKAQKITKVRKNKLVYTVIGFPSVDFTHPDSDVLEVIRAVLGKGMSGRLFDEIRIKRGLGYDVGVHHEASATYGFFACYVSAEPDKIEECERIIHEEMEKCSKVTDKELAEAKNYLEGEFIFENESNEKLADSLCVWEQSGILDDFEKAVEKIRKVTKDDIRRVASRYMRGRYAKATIRPE